MSSTPERRSRHGMPFEIHRLVEYLLGVGLLAAAMRPGAPTPVLVGAGAVLLLLAAFTRGRLGIRAWCPRGLHRFVDVVTVIGLAAVPFLPGIGGLGTALYVLPPAAIMAFLFLSTEYRSVKAAPAGDEPQAPPSPRVDAAAKGMGRLIGRAWLAAEGVRPAVRRDRSDAPETTGANDSTIPPDPTEPVRRPTRESAAHRLGRVAGRLSWVPRTNNRR